MGKRKKRALERQLEREREKVARLLPKPRPFWRQWLSGTNFLMTTASVIAGLLLAWLTLRPHVSMHPGERIDEKNPFTTQFVVTNEGWFAVRDVTSNCYYGDVQTSHNVGVFAWGLPNVETFDSIEPHKSVTIACRQALGGFGHGTGDITKATIALTVNYNPEFWWKRSERYGFKVLVDTKNIAHWEPFSLPDP